MNVVVDMLVGGEREMGGRRRCAGSRDVAARVGQAPPGGGGQTDGDRAPLRVLVIEDDAASQELMRYLLAAAGHEVVIAADGPEGVELARRTRFDLILCDLVLPSLHGFAVARRLRADPMLCHIPLVAVTALEGAGGSLDVYRAGFDACVPKPIAPEAFTEQVTSFVRSRGGH